MKKLLSLLLALIMLLSLCACGSGESTMTKEELLEHALPFDPDEICLALGENKLAAEDKYLNKTYTFEALVRSIEEDGCELYFPVEQHQGRVVLNTSSCNYSIKVPLSRDELITLKVDDVLSIVAQLSSIEYTSSLTDFGSIYSVLNCTFENAVLLENRGVYTVTWTGQLMARNTKNDAINGIYPYNIQLDDNPYTFLVYFKDDVNMDEYRWKTVKLVGEPWFAGGDRFDLVNAELVEVLD